MKVYRVFSIILMVLFAVTGLLFLFIPDRVLTLFNQLSSPWGMPVAPLTGLNFYLILAVGYMYLVTVLAFFMYLHPENRYFPQLLIHAKFASSVLSLALFVVHEHYLIYLVNFLIDGGIGGLVLVLYFRIRKQA